MNGNGRSNIMISIKDEIAKILEDNIDELNGVVVDVRHDPPEFRVDFFL